MTPVVRKTACQMIADMHGIDKYSCKKRIICCEVNIYLIVQCQLYSDFYILDWIYG